MFIISEAFTPTEILKLALLTFLIISKIIFSEWDLWVKFLNNIPCLFIGLIVFNEIFQILRKNVALRKVERLRLSKLQEAIWLTVVNKIQKNSNQNQISFIKWTFCWNSLGATPTTRFRNDTFGLVSRLLERDFVNYRKIYDFVNLSTSVEIKPNVSFLNWVMG